MITALVHRIKLDLQIIVASIPNGREKSDVARVRKPSTCAVVLRREGHHELVLIDLKAGLVSQCGRIIVDGWVPALKHIPELVEAEHESKYEDDH